MEKSQTFSAQLRQRLASLERRDWELWVLSLLTVGILAAGMFFVLLPDALVGQKTIYLRATITPQMLLGMIVLVLLFIIYLIRKHIQIRQLRLRSIVETWNSEVSHMQMMIDPLTQAYSRSALEEILGRELKRVLRKQATMVFLYIDVNNFKNVNTRYGHLSGDLVLAEVGSLLKQCVRGSDYVIRLGGDEFLAALVDTNEQGAETVKNRIRQRTHDWNENSPLPGFSLHLSIGIEQFDGSRTFDEVLADADAKMYAEKKQTPSVS